MFSPLSWSVCPFSLHFPTSVLRLLHSLVSDSVLLPVFPVHHWFCFYIFLLHLFSDLPLPASLAFAVCQSCFGGLQCLYQSWLFVSLPACLGVFHLDPFCVNHKNIIGSNYLELTYKKWTVSQLLNWLKIFILLKDTSLWTPQYNPELTVCFCSLTRTAKWELYTYLCFHLY